METIVLNEIRSIIPWFMKKKTVWANYDEESDVLYMHFKKPNHADDSEMTVDDIIVRFEKGEIIGLTVLNASKR